MTHTDEPRGAPVAVAVSATIRDVEGAERVRLNAAYVRTLESVGLIPVVIPPLGNPGGVTGVLDLVAGLLLTGGEDVDPSVYGQEPHPELGTVSRARDVTELALLASARERRLPTLAICRGVQLVNVGFGGTLVQDLPSQRDDAHAHELDDLRDARVHTVRVAPASRLAAVVGDHAIRVNSVHHQAIDRLGTGLRPNAWAEDGIIEGVESGDADWWMLGVQWHPEELLETPEHWDRRLLDAFADACRATASRRVARTTTLNSPSTSLPSAPAA